MIQPLKSTSMSYAEQHMVDPSSSDKQPVQEIMFVHETAKKLNIIPESDESSEDESIFERSAAKKRKLKSVDDNVSDILLRMKGVHNVSKDDDILSQGSENHINKQEGEDENEDVSDYDMDNENNDFTTFLGEVNMKMKMTAITKLIMEMKMIAIMIWIMKMYQ